MLRSRPDLADWAEVIQRQKTHMSFVKNYNIEKSHTFNPLDMQNRYSVLSVIECLLGMTLHA